MFCAKNLSGINVTGFQKLTRHLRINPVFCSDLQAIKVMWPITAGVQILVTNEARSRACIEERNIVNCNVFALSPGCLIRRALQQEMEIHGKMDHKCSL